MKKNRYYERKKMKEKNTEDNYRQEERMHVGIYVFMDIRI